MVGSPAWAVDPPTRVGDLPARVGDPSVRVGESPVRGGDSSAGVGDSAALVVDSTLRSLVAYSPSGGTDCSAAERSSTQHSPGLGASTACTPVASRPVSTPARNVLFMPHTRSGAFAVSG